MQLLVSHSGSTTFAGGGIACGVSKQFASGAAIGGSTFGTSNGAVTPTMSVGASTQLFTLTNGVITERTVDAENVAFTAEFGATSFDASAAAMLKYLLINYSVTDLLYMP
jgi:hypothetical protein